MATVKPCCVFFSCLSSVIAVRLGTLPIITIAILALMRKSAFCRSINLRGKTIGKLAIWMTLRKRFWWSVPWGKWSAGIWCWWPVSKSWWWCVPIRFMRLRRSWSAFTKTAAMVISGIRRAAVKPWLRLRLRRCWRITRILKSACLWWIAKTWIGKRGKNLIGFKRVVWKKIQIQKPWCGVYSPMTMRIRWSLPRFRSWV